MVEHTAHSRQVLDLDKMLGEKRVRLDEQEWDLELCMAVLAEAQAQGISS
jgi:hypothetical protein